MHSWSTGPSTNSDSCNSSWVGPVYGAGRGFWESLNSGNHSSICLTPAINCGFSSAGDLSARASSILDQQQAHVNATSSLTYYDFQLTLYGEYSIIGRSLVVNFNTSASAVPHCGNVLPPPKSMNATIEVAVFNNSLYSGEMVFVQDADNSFADTTILMNIEAASPSSNHQWRIQSTPAVDGGCKTDGPDFNPFAVCVTQCPAWYAPCDASNMLSCEVGDLSGKHGPLNFSPSARYVFTDTTLPLSGVGSILGHSIALSGANSSSSKVACSNFLSANSVSATATFIYQGVVGTIVLEQSSEVAPVMVTINLTGLEAGVYDLIVHELPSRFPSPSLSIACGAASLGRPYGIGSSTICLVHK